MPIRVAYDSENEAILLIRASKMLGSYLVFDLKLACDNRIEFFTRTGVSQEAKGESVSIREIVTVADRAVSINDSIIEHSTMEIAKAYDAHYFIPEVGRRISSLLIDNLRNGKYRQINKAGHLFDFPTETKSAQVLPECLSESCLCSGGKVAFHRRFQDMPQSIPPQGMAKDDFLRLLRPFIAAIKDGLRSS